VWLLSEQRLCDRFKKRHEWVLIKKAKNKKIWRLDKNKKGIEELYINYTM
jgi:hypothetical protein